MSYLRILRIVRPVEYPDAVVDGLYVSVTSWLIICESFPEQITCQSEFDAA